ncbi:diphosphomevalonate decarboxylase [Erysipelothrix rhusiopathiae]|uniref:diphosphomevalonate decarboxylase n=1 Tax=Erysipelothrix sp. strain 2 (EsS2-7-Brazil) TaxID=2500579 RepID=UPI0013777D11|nr:diphosphomevalonate decarboxylase [Erysipelothrix sp. strain 2 (EsS2-7-Brazil)]MBK2403806.1 diphosphomevalonate decarboxylase [Erysipelothrix sp. strain 2 (EsS2-7-Brazil)]NBA01079.1 diphosphomevalonate decarboxylase [Erysipelothrix rhusiopathiae]
MTKTIRAHTNIALIKYWGKKDNELKIPHNSSLSMTLDQFYTDTWVEYDATLTEDIFILDGYEVEGKEKDRVVWYMNELRKRYPLPYFARIHSTNFVPKAAGLASSASAFAALAKAATLNLDLSDEEVSRCARLGSGSASRSIYGGFVKWNRGSNDLDSFAEPIIMKPWPEFRMIVCILNDQEKPFLSSQAMNTTVEESVYYPAWVEQTEKDIINLESALKEHDIWTVGAIAQQNALRMHASLMAVNMWYFEPQTVEIMNKVRKIQKTVPAFFTMDAGPNVKIMTTSEHVETVLAELEGVKTVVCAPGVGVSVYDSR